MGLEPDELPGGLLILLSQTTTAETTAFTIRDTRLILNSGDAVCFGVSGSDPHSLARGAGHGFFPGIDNEVLWMELVSLLFSLFGIVFTSVFEPLVSFSKILVRDIGVYSILV